MIGFEMAGCFQHFIIQVNTLQPIPLERHETAHLKNDFPGSGNGFWGSSTDGPGNFISSDNSIVNHPFRRVDRYNIVLL